MLFYIILVVFLLRIAENMYMAWVVFYYRLTKKPGGMSFPLFGVELIIIPVLVLSSAISDLEQWWAKPLAILWLSAAITIASYLVICSSR
jgi:hypothetical protein